jgi:hypothetical protein
VQVGQQVGAQGLRPSQRVTEGNGQYSRAQPDDGHAKKMIPARRALGRVLR